MGNEGAAIRYARNLIPDAKEIVDVGASVGKITEYLLKLFPEARVHAFEPHPYSFEKLVRRVGDYRERVALHEVALGNGEIIEDLHCGPFRDASSLFPISEKWRTNYSLVGDGFDNTVEVEIDTLWRYAEVVGLDHIDLLKLDAQGSELNILRGAASLLKRGGIGLVICEVMFIPFYEGAPLAGEVLQYMADLSYYPKGIWLSGGPQEWARHADILFALG